MSSFLLSLAFVSIGVGPDSTATCLGFEENLHLHAALELEVATTLYLDSLLSCGVGDPEVLVTTGRYYYARNEHENSIRMLTEALQMPGISRLLAGEAHYYISLNHSEKKNFVKAMDHAIEARAYGFQIAWTYNTTGVAWWKQGEDQKSIEAYEKAVAIDPGYALAYSNMGNSYRKLRRHDKALVYYSIADSLELGRNARYRSNMTRAARDLDLLELEEELARKAIEDFPNDRNVICDQANVLAKKHQYGEIRGLLDRLIRLSANSDWDWFDLALLYSNVGNVDSAYYCYRIALNINENNSSAHHNIGLIYKDHGRFEEAHRHYDRAIELDKWNYRVYGAKAGAYLWQFDYQSAYEWELKHAEHLPNGRRNGLGIGYSLMHLKKYTEAIPYFEDALSLKPDDDRALNNLGRCYTLLGDHEKATRYFDEALAINAENSFIYHNRAALYTRSGDHQKACIDLAKALELEYNWIIDPELEEMRKLHCSEINVDRKILIHQYRGNLKEMAHLKFMEVIGSDGSLIDIPAIPWDTTLISLEKELLTGSGSFRIFPNPASDHIYIEAPNGGTDHPVFVKIYDPKGALVHQEAFIGSRMEVAVSDLPAGTYVVMFLDDRSVKGTLKVMVAH